VIQNEKDFQGLHELSKTNEELLKEVTLLRKENEILKKQQRETQQLLIDARNALSSMATLQRERDSALVSLQFQFYVHFVSCLNNERERMRKNKRECGVSHSSKLSFVFFLVFFKSRCLWLKN
jgi:hypothetical protein